MCHMSALPENDARLLQKYRSSIAFALHFT